MNSRRAIGSGALPLPTHLANFGWETVRYGLTSALALACDVAVYALMLGSLTPPAAGAIGYAMGLLVHHALSSNWVFPDRTGRRHALPTFAKFAASGLMGLIMTAGIIGALTMSGLAGVFEAKAAAVGVTYVAVFLVRRRYVFARRGRIDG